MQQEYSRDIDLLVQNIMFDLRPAIYNALMSRLKAIFYQHNEEAIKEIIETTIKTLQINRPKDTVAITCIHCKTSHKVSMDVYDKMAFCPFCGIKMKKPSLEEETRRKYNAILNSTVGTIEYFRPTSEETQHKGNAETKRIQIFRQKGPAGVLLKDPVKIICPSCKLEVEVERNDFNKMNFLCPWCEAMDKVRIIMEVKPTLEETGHESNTEATETEITD